MRIYLEGRAPGWKLHSLYDSLIGSPPEGFSFIVQENGSSGGLALRSLDSHLSGLPYIKSVLDFAKPSVYYSFYRMMGLFSTRPTADLIYSSQHLISGRIPWVVDLEFITGLIGYGSLRFVKHTLERALASEFCRKIMPWTDMGRKTLTRNLDCTGFEDKIETVHLAVPPKNFERQNHNDSTRLLFVGTGNIFNMRRSFELKGGRELLLAFRKLRRTYDKIELTIRSRVPDDYRDFCSRERIRVLPNVLPVEELATEFENADIFVFPGHSTPGMVILDAMSYELPVVATDVWATRETVADGRTGFLTKPSRFATYQGADMIPCWADPSFWQSIERIDPDMVEDIVAKVSLLLEDPRLRRQLGRNGRSEIEAGRFSLTERNRKLSRIFRESISGQND